MHQICAIFRYECFTRSQSSAATHVSCGGMLNGNFVAYLLVNLSVKKNENQSKFGEVMNNIIVDCFL